MRYPKRPQWDARFSVENPENRPRSFGVARFVKIIAVLSPKTFPKNKKNGYQYGFGPFDAGRPCFYGTLYILKYLYII
jgi:hypothetical protein